MNALLYLYSALGSGCGFMTQMLVSGYWTTAFSEDVYHYSINLAFYFLSLGIGTLLSNRVRHPHPSHLTILVVGIAFWVGACVPLLRFGITYLGYAPWLPITTVAIAGILSGAVIPLTLRVAKAHPTQFKKVRLASVFFFDYAAAIGFTLIFTLYALIRIGYSRTALWICFGSLACLFVATLFEKAWQPKAKLRWNFFALGVAALLIVPLYQTALTLPQRVKRTKGIGRVLATHQSQYQKIVLAEHDANQLYFPGQKSYVLYLDGFIQFSTMSERSYHLCIANIPAAAVEKSGGQIKQALILGGGDALAARNLLALPQIESVTLVELDPSVLNLAYNHPILRKQNEDALRHPKLKPQVADAFHWVVHAAPKQQYDLIVIDFPYPKNITLSRLFSSEFYRHALGLLKPGGFAAIQAGPSYSHDDPYNTVSRVTASVKKTVESVGYPAYIYNNGQDEDGFVLTHRPDPNRPSFQMDRFATEMGMMGARNLGRLCGYNPKWILPDVEITTLNTLTISRYMLDWIQRSKRQFRYSGSLGVLLPE